MKKIFNTILISLFAIAFNANALTYVPASMVTGFTGRVVGTNGTSLEIGENAISNENLAVGSIGLDDMSLQSFNYIVDVYSTNQPINLVPTNGLVLWMDASDVATFTLDGGNLVDQWNDKSTNAYAYTPATPSRKPLWLDNATNGLDAVRVGNNSLRVLNPNALPTGSGGRSIFMAMKFPSAVSPQRVYFGWSDVGTVANNASFYFANFGGNPAHTNLTIWGANHDVTVCSWMLSSTYAFALTYEANQLTIYRDQHLCFNNAAETAFATQNGYSRIGGSLFDNDDPSVTDFDLYEILVYDRVVTAQERFYILAYLERWR